MKNSRFGLLSLGLLLTGNAIAQLTIDTTYTAAQLANELAGPGVMVSSALFFGQGYQKAYFDGSASNIAMQSGVLLGTGDVRLALGPAGDQQQMFGWITDSDDDDLDELVAYVSIVPLFGDTTWDRSVLEMDVVPVGDSLFVTTVFASKEYPEFVCYNTFDVAGIFLSGPGIAGPYTNGAVNLLTVPGSDAPVCVSSINSGDSLGGPGSSCAEVDPDWQDNTIYYVDNTEGPTIGYDGFTVPIHTTAAVQAGATYHVKFAVADVADSGWDSGFFIAAGSLRSNISMAVQPQLVNHTWRFEQSAAGGGRLVCTEQLNGTVRLVIHDALGRLVRTSLHTGSVLSVGENGSGVYSYEITAGGHSWFGRFYAE